MQLNRKANKARKTVKNEDNGNAGIAMRVLVITTILVMLCLFSVLSVSAVQVSENVKFQTTGTNTTFIMGSNFTFDLLEVHPTYLTLGAATISVQPSVGTINFTLFNLSSDYTKWNETCSNPVATTNHTLGGMKTNTVYKLKADGAVYGYYTTNESGYVFFTYSGGYSDIVFELTENGAAVHNLNTSKSFLTIQAAIYDSETLSGHIISVDPGTYNETVVVNKSVTIKSTSGDSADTIVNASNPDKHVFEVTVDLVNISGFTLENATGNGKAGIYLGDGVNRCNITNNTLKSNYNGIYLENADDNNITCNWVHGNTRAGFNLTGGSTGNNISHNNIVENGGFNGSSGGWEWLFYNNQNNITDATNNWWGCGMTNETVNASIYDWTYNNTRGNVTVLPRLNSADPCAPIPELSTVVLLGVGLLMLAGYLRIRWKR